MSFDQIYETYWDKVYRLCMGYVYDTEWAKDITQDTFVTVWQQLSNFRNESSVGTWIFRIACNSCLRQMEKSRRFVIPWPENRILSNPVPIPSLYERPIPALCRK